MGESVVRINERTAYFEIISDEETAIFIAVRKGRLGLVKKLLDMGADPTIMNRNDSTCLHEAAANCNLSMVEELLRHNSVVKEVSGRFLDRV